MITFKNMISRMLKNDLNKLNKRKIKFQQFCLHLVFKFNL